MQTNAPKEFNPLSIPIQGTNLIEASAGTGKTWSIAALFLRLVLLERMAVDKILVVTFTNAATAELKTRLRSRLDDALRELQALGGDEQAESQLQDAFNQRPVKRQQHASLPEFEPFLFDVLCLALQQEPATRLRLRLQAAINQFDHAGIFTIHGFCQRVLREFAFLCQVPFQMTLADDTQAPQLRLAGDFWRKQVINHSQLARLCVERKLTPASALANIKKWLSRQDLGFKLSQSDQNLEAIQQELQLVTERLAQQMAVLETQFWEIHPQLNGTSYNKNTYSRLFGDINDAVLTGRWQQLDQASMERMARFQPEVLVAKTKKGVPALSETQSVAFVDLANVANLLQQQDAANQALFDQLHYDLYQYIVPQWQHEKQRLQQLGFDDLLSDVAKALHTPANEHSPHFGTLLAQRISEQMWNVALIDEFQDTDPLQYGIFEAIFIQNNKPVFLVGDPKQAIYRFRGADIHAYLLAKQQTNSHYTLATNRRTHQNLVHAVNSLFLNKTLPFVLKNIDYIDVKASRADSHLSPNPHPLQIQWLMQPDEAVLTKNVARERAASYCAQDIARHLALSQNGQLQYRGGELKAKHIAVLVRTHHEGEMVRAALQQEHVDSVILSRESVFASVHAKAVLTLLQWWLNPRQQGLLRSVLASDLFGWRSSDLWRLNQASQQEELIAWMEDAIKAQELWQQRGIYAAWQMFDRKRGITAHFLQRGDKRGLTNVQQMFELLAQEAVGHFGAEALVQWLSERLSDAYHSDATSLRLESDEELVKIVTMHASKGLEYPVVFCPFVWDNKDFKEDDFNLVHDTDGNVCVVSKPCLDESTQNTLSQDDLSENLRLVYVAFTRAAEKLVLSSCLITDSHKNVVHYLLTPPADANTQAVQDAWEALPKVKPKAEASQKSATAQERQQWYLALWQQWANAKNVAWLWRAEKPEYAGLVDDSKALPQFQALKVALPYYRLQEYTSFSGISRHLRHTVTDELVPELDTAELQDASMVLAEVATEDAPAEFGIYAFQRGTEAGLCLHALLENTDFSQAAASQAETYASTLEQYQIAPEWYPALYQMIDDTRLGLLDHGVCLADIAADKQLPEMGFVLRVDDFNTADIEKWLQNSSLPATIKHTIRGMVFRDIAGFLNGFIDLTCVAQDGRVYVVDYKSNHLGSRLQDYQDASLDHAITEHKYYLQALIYALAVERYLQARQYKPQSIHIRYLFLRGMQAHQGIGVWRWDIPVIELDKLTPNLLHDNIDTVKHFS